MSLQLLDYQCNSIGGHAFASPYETELLGSGGFDGNGIGGNAHGLCQTVLHRRNMRIDFGGFSAYGAVDVANGITFVV